MISRVVSFAALAFVLVTAAQATIVNQENSRIIVIGGKDAQIDGEVQHNYEVLKWNGTDYVAECGIGPNVTLPSLPVLPAKTKASDAFAFYTGGKPYFCLQGGRVCYRINTDFTYTEVDNPGVANGTYVCSPNPATSDGARLIYTASNLVGLSDTTVLVVGADPNKKYFDAYNANTVTTTCLFDSETETWSQGPDLPYASFYQCVVRTEWQQYGKFLLMTGIDTNGNVSDTAQDNSVSWAYTFDTATMTFTQISNYPWTTRQAMCPLVNTNNPNYPATVLGYGGQIDADSFLLKANKLLSSGRWDMGPNVQSASHWGKLTGEPYPNGWYAALQVHYADAFVLVGGTFKDGNGNKTLSGNVYTVASNTNGNGIQFTQVGTLNTPRKFAAAVAVPDTYWNFTMNATICNP